VTPAPAGGIARQSRRVMNLSGFLTQIAQRLPDRPGLIWGERSWSWAELESRAAALAAGLASLGVGKGDRVLVHSKNSDELVVAMFATFRAGAVFVPTNFRLLPAEVVELAQTARPAIALVHGHFPDHAAALVAADAVPRIVRLGPGTLGETAVATLSAAHRDAPVPTAEVEHDDPCWFFFTSGTTGKSKAAVLTHGHMAFVILSHISDLMPDLTDEDASLVVAPLSHGAGVHALTQVARGAVSILLPSEKFDPDEVFRLVARHRVTNMFTVPTILKLLAEHPSVDAHDHSSLRHVIYAGAPMYRADQQMILGKLGRVIVQYFGLGEVTGAITVLPARLHDAADDWPLAGSCGFPRTGMQVAIMDDAGRELAPGETGEICVVGPAVFAGYFDNPDANAKSFRDGWFRTGDLGHLDDRGFLFITGRASDMYISGGSNIYPREIEEKLLTHPAIAEVAVLGVPDPKWGEVGIAVCVAREPVGEAALLAWLAERIARYKLPRRVVFWDALPKSGYGKVPKRLVREQLLARGELAAPAA
jgi:fatty-acyl-CoA synthase